MVKETVVFQTHWRSPGGEDAGHSSHDKWKSSNPQGKRKWISLEMDAFGVNLENKDAHFEQKLQRKRQKRVRMKQDDRKNAAIDERQ